MKRLYLPCVILWLLLMLASCSVKEEVLPAETMVFSESTGISWVSEPTRPSTIEVTTVTTETVSQVRVEPEDADFVRVLDHIPDLVIDLKYAGEDNFTGVVIYNSNEAWLRYGTVKKLIQVQAELNQLGYGLKLWDGFRPPAAQFKLWEICPEPIYVANPNNGFSNHSRGNTVDVTLVDIRSNELEMPTGFDDFSSLADRDYSDCSAEAAANAKLLESIMEQYGFKGYRGEWWHYTDSDSYEVEQEFIP